MKILLAVILIVSLFTLSCGQTVQNTTVLGSMLSSIPFELASTTVLWFGNMEKIKNQAGVAQDISLNDFAKNTTDREVFLQRMDLLSGYNMSHFSGGTYLEYWQEFFGFNAFATTQEIWGEAPEGKGFRPLFSVMKGNFDKDNIVSKLNGLGYQTKKYSSIDYYSIRSDNQFDPKSSQVSRLSMNFLNRIMVEKQTIIAAPADDILFSILDGRSGKQSSLKDSLAYARVAESLGDVLGAALLPQPLLRSENVNPDWNPLHAYDLAAIAYRVEGQDKKMVIALHYADKSAAKDIEELKHRLSEYQVTSGGVKTPLLSDLFAVGAPEVTTYNADSILKIELVHKSVNPSTLWSDLVESQDLGFLVVNPSQ